jgi:hypothetical protein
MLTSTAYMYIIGRIYLPAAKTLVLSELTTRKKDK